MACICSCARRPRPTLVGPSSQLSVLESRRSYGKKYKPIRTASNDLLCQYPKPKGDAKGEPRHFANFYNYADGSRGMQLLTSPRRSVSFARDITTHSLWAFAGEDKVDSSDMTGMLGRFARRMGTEGSVEDRMKTSQMFEDVFEQAGAAEVVAEKKPPPAPTATGGKGKGKAGAKKK